MAELQTLLEGFGITDAMLQAGLVGLLVFLATLLVVSSILSHREKKRSLAAQDEYERLQNL